MPKKLLQLQEAAIKLINVCLLQLQNKEETISVQADSLAVAEERIATLNERANELKKELDRKTKEVITLILQTKLC